MNPSAEARQTLSFRVLAALLHYPDAALQAHAHELHALLREEGLLLVTELEAVEKFTEYLARGDLLELQSAYVETFDRGRARSLYLFEHVYGESRDRGQAMVLLAGRYRQHGFEITARELPDYLPLVLEFLSQVDRDVADELLSEVGELLSLLHAQLTKRDSIYAVLLQPLLRLSGVAADDAEVQARVASEVPDDTPAALDAVWMEAPVTFSPAAGCGDDHSRSPEHAIEWQGRRPAGLPARHRGGQ